MYEKCMFTSEFDKIKIYPNKRDSSNKSYRIQEYVSNRAIAYCKHRVDIRKDS